MKNGGTARRSEKGRQNKVKYVRVGEAGTSIPADLVDKYMYIPFPIEHRWEALLYYKLFLRL